MNISQSTNNLNFQSKIKFVSYDKFNELGFCPHFYCGVPSQPLETSMLKGEKMWTWEIRTCTGGGVVDKSGAVGFHFYNSKENINKVKKDFLAILKQWTTEPISALIIGSKDIPSSPESIPLFETVLDNIKKVVKPSMFKTYSNIFSESDIAYEKATDTWFINTSKPKNPMIPINRIDVASVDDLKSSFNSISIAPQDRLFINEKEISRLDYPELFTD